MATITNSVVVESVDRGSYKRNLYRYTIDNGEVHEQRGWIPTSTDNATDMAMRGTLLLESLVQAEINRELG
jgi:hypothetical protein